MSGELSRRMRSARHARHLAAKDQQIADLTRELEQPQSERCAACKPAGIALPVRVATDHDDDMWWVIDANEEAVCSGCSFAEADQIAGLLNAESVLRELVAWVTECVDVPYPASIKMCSEMNAGRALLARLGDWGGARGEKA